MTETEIHVEHAPEEHHEEHHEDLAGAIAAAQVEAAHTLQQEADVETAQETAETALQAVSEHEHPEYARIEHGHPELDGRLDTLESRLDDLVRGFEESIEEPEWRKLNQ
jgi:hypothetical protein